MTDWKKRKGQRWRLLHHVLDVTPLPLPRFQLRALAIRRKMETFPFFFLRVGTELSQLPVLLSASILPVFQLSRAAAQRLDVNEMHDIAEMMDAHLDSSRLPSSQYLNKTILYSTLACVERGHQPKYRLFTSFVGHLGSKHKRAWRHVTRQTKQVKHVEQQLKREWRLTEVSESVVTTSLTRRAANAPELATELMGKKSTLWHSAARHGILAARSVGERNVVRR